MSSEGQYAILPLSRMLMTGRGLKQYMKVELISVDAGRMVNV